MTPADLLDAAADKIEPEGAWTRRALARAKNGNCTDPNKRDAVCWCVIGALNAVNGGMYEAAMSAFRRRVGRPLDTWNDAPGRTQAEVVALLRTTANELRGRG